MLGQPAAHRLLQIALRALPPAVAGVPVQGDAFLGAREAALSRFANNAIHQNVAEANARVVVRAAVGGRLGTATTNDLSPAGLERAAQAALALAQLRPENPDFKGLPAPQPVAEVSAFDEAAATCAPERRARAIGIVCARAAESGLAAAGAFETAAVEQGVASTAGVQAYQAGTQVEFQVVAMSTDSSGWAQQAAWRLDDLDPEALGEEAIATALRGRGPRSVEPGVYPVVLAADAVQDIVSMLAVPGAGAQAVQEGRSWMSGRIGQALMHPAVSIWDDGRDLRGWPLAFDGEGVPKQRVDIVKDGVAAGPVYDSLSAGREPGKHSTGHALPPFDPLVANGGPMTQNLCMAAGAATVAEMIAATRQGVYVARFWYTRTVHPREAIITGLTRDGTFWIEDGALAYPVYNLRFTQAYVKALADVEMVGRDTRTSSTWQGTATVPALKVAAFNFTGVSPKG